MDLNSFRTTSNSDISEIYSMPRVTTIASQRGLKPGFSMDIRNGWNFNDPKHRAKAIEKLESEKPVLLVGSPPCTMFSTITRLWNLKKMTPEVRSARMKEAILHVAFAVKLYKIQIAGGRFFLHEHPDQASSWDLRCIQDLLKAPGVQLVRGDMCAFGMQQEDKEGVGYIRKRTKFCTNCPEVAAELEHRCDGTHRHITLVDGRPSKAATYPPKLCAAICRGLEKYNNKSLTTIPHKNPPCDGRRDGSGNCAIDELFGNPRVGSLG